MTNHQVNSPTCRFATLVLTVAVALSAASSGEAADNQLSAAEQEEGWVLLFDGQDLAGWMNNNGQPVRAKVENGAINVHGTGGYLLVYEKPFGDFVLKCDVLMDQPCNSGIFLRTGDLEDPVQSAIEVQIHSDEQPSMHGFGALYDLVAPSKNASRGPGQWDSLEIRCKGPEIAVIVNGEQVSSINCDKWYERGRRPDGTRHKFKKAIKEFPRQGYIGLQDHGQDVWFKNIKLRAL